MRRVHRSASSSGTSLGCSVVFLARAVIESVLWHHGSIAFQPQETLDGPLNITFDIDLQCVGMDRAFDCRRQRLFGHVCMPGRCVLNISGITCKSICTVPQVFEGVVGMEAIHRGSRVARRFPCMDLWSMRRPPLTCHWWRNICGRSQPQPRRGAANFEDGNDVGRRVVTWL